MTRRGVNPCLVCAEPANGPKGGVVCDECVRKVRDYDAQRERFLGERVAIALDLWAYVPASGRGNAQDKARDALKELLNTMRRALEPKKSSKRYWADIGEVATRASELGIERTIKSGFSSSSGSITLNAPRELAQFLLDLEPAIYLAVEEARDNGVREGSNLLAQLAAGELHTADFERRAGITPKGER